ncbi:Smr protein/MutS2 C-terminal [Penicillium digitatum]|uniref:Smr protein/MutS2 C-terminal n=1 Tax=Penicillium digitatum TaxID=36651 RepID=A0A7T7BJX5_PENDI|nr:Smr protein/MutS2 C-terminal [Penicillium digitatum]
MGDCGDELLKELESTYCPPIDPALFVAIVSDFDLAIPTQVKQLRETLDVLNASAVEQENLPFDPTGTTNLRNSDVSGSLIGGSSDDATSDFTSWPSLENHERDNSNSTSTSREAERLKSSKLAYTFLGMTTADKAQNLISMFPTIPRLEAERILEDCHDNLSRSMDVLLNLAFIEETQIARDTPQETPKEVAKDVQTSISKSIDGFQAKENQNGGGKNSRKRKKQKQRRVDLVSQAMNNTTNRWEAGKKDIEFLSTRASALQREKIASTYHENSMSLCATIRVLAQAHAPKDIHEIEDDPRLVTQVGELSHKYPEINPMTLSGLIQIANNEIPAADDLADTLARRPDLTSVSNIISFVSSPVALDNEEEEENVAPIQQTESTSDFMDFNEAAAAANSHFAARSAALAQAAQAARRARSNPLYGGASAYYRDVGNEQRQLAMRHLATASDRLVARQSSQYDLDLHGVTVANAIRIARERVQAWWDGLGDQKYVRGGGQSSHGGFNIVCGVGHHSLDRKSHIGPAVWNMLLKEGWRVELNRGSMLVTGVNRR